MIDKKTNNNIFYLIFLTSFMTFAISCNGVGLDSYTLTLNDEDAVKAKGGYYYLEEEENANGKVEYPALEYYQSTEWSEASYGTYLMHQDVSVEMNGSSITQKTTKIDVQCTARIHKCNHTNEVIKNISGSSEVKFIRSKSADLQKVDNDEKAYDRASFLFLFVNSSTALSEKTYNYTFSSPVPYLLRNDLSPSSYKDRLSKDLAIDYTYTSNNPDDPSGSVQLRVSLESSSSSRIKIKVSNILNDCGNDKKQAERYGYFPFPKDITYTINLKKNKKITEYKANTETLVSQHPKGSAAAYNVGNPAPTTVETKLCKYTLSGKVDRFSCGK